MNYAFEMCTDVVTWHYYATVTDLDRNMVILFGPRRKSIEAAWKAGVDLLLNLAHRAAQWTPTA